MTSCRERGTRASSCATVTGSRSSSRAREADARTDTNTQTLRIRKYEVASRLFVGTGKYPSLEIMQQAHVASGAQVVTVAIRRMHLDDKSGKTLVDYIDRTRMTLLPNTAGCYTAKDAVLTAKLAREALGTDLIKVEVIGDAETLYPDTRETIAACEELVREGFTVLPYVADDPVACKRLRHAAC